MKRKIYLLCSILAGGIMTSGCSDTWDDHYKGEESVVENTSITSVNQPITSYLANEESLSGMYQLFQETGVLEQLNNITGQLYTVLAVEGQGPKAAKAESSADDIYMAQSYVSSVGLAPSSITNGQRIKMWNGKFLEITKSEDDETIKFANSEVSRIVKLNDGYLYVLKEEVESPRSLYETIKALGDDYSIFREMVLSRNQIVFDKANSEVIDVDATGNNVYDSIFIEKASYFESKGFDLMSEGGNSTLLIPSNEVINEAISTAKRNLSDWGLEREDSVLQNWVFQSMFYNTRYTKEDFETNTDLKSVFGTQWRTTVQEVDLDNPVTLSNGIAYYVKKIKIPTNVLIYRLKDYYRWYEYMTASEISTYFVTENLSYEKIRQSSKMSGLGWTQAGVDKYGNYLFPEIEYYYVLAFTLTDSENKSYELTFTPFKFTGDANAHTVRDYKIPPGEYDLCLGFEQNKNHELGDIEVYFNGKYITKVSDSQLTGSGFHYDRAGQGYPEGFDTNAAKKAGWSKAGNYDRDGTKVGTVTIEGDEARTVELRFVGSGSKLARCWLHHWCLKPTSNCY